MANEKIQKSVPREINEYKAGKRSLPPKGSIPPPPPPPPNPPFQKKETE